MFPNQATANFKSGHEASTGRSLDYRRKNALIAFIDPHLAFAGGEMRHGRIRSANASRASFILEFPAYKKAAVADDVCLALAMRLATDDARHGPPRAERMPR